MDQSGYADLINSTSENTDIVNISSSLTLSYANPFGILETDAGSNVIATNLTNGQVLIGSTGAAPVAANITGTTNQINIINGVGTITLSTPQNIDTAANVTFGQIIDSGLNQNVIVCTGLADNQLHSVTINNTNTNGTNNSLSFNSGTLTMASSMTQDLRTSATPTFANLIDSGLTASELVASNASKQLQSVTIANANGCNTKFLGSTLTTTMTQDLGTTGLPTFVSVALSGIADGDLLVIQPTTKHVIGIAASDGSLPIGSTSDGTYSAGNITGSSNISVTNGSHTITLDTAQNITTSSTPTFANIIDSGLTATRLVATNASKQLQSVTISNANGTNNSFSGSTLACTMTQDLQTSATPSFTGLNGNGILQYVIGTISQSLTTVTGSGTTFTSAMAGGLLIPAKGEATVIQTFNSATSLTVYKSQTIAAGSQYTIFYTLGSNGFAISPYGTMLLRTLGSGLQSTTGLTLQLVPNGGGGSYNVDIDTYNSPYTQPCNGRLQFTDNNFGANFSYFSKIQGADTNALQRLFQVSADKTVTTFNNILDTTTTGDANFAGTVTIGTGLLLPTSGGTPTLLDYYEEYIHTTTWSGPITTTGNTTVRIVRIGKNVTIQLPQFTGTGNNTNTKLLMNTNIPTQFRPSSDIAWESAWIIVMGANMIGEFRIFTSGQCAFNSQFGLGWTPNVLSNGTGIIQCFSYYLF